MSQLRDKLSEVMRLQEQSNYLQAYDVSMQMLKLQPDSLALQHHAVLALIRSGMIGKAKQLHELWNLSQTDRLDRAALAGTVAMYWGADIMFAEGLLDRGAELHVVIPFRKDEFVDTSVRRGGKDWLARFNVCFEKASSLSYATEDECLGDPELFSLGSDMAMGMANTRSHATDLPLKQLLVWDGKETTGFAGTNWLKRRWESCGLPISHFIGCVSSETQTSGARPAAQHHATGREVKALLFGDIKGFSKLREDLLPNFWEIVVGGLTETIKEFQLETKAIDYWNTWGDAVYVVVNSVSHGAECAIRLQELMKRIDFESAGLPADMSMRFGAHLGPVYRSADPVNNNVTWYGSQVSRAARIEPVSKEGEIFVSEQFAYVAAVEAYNRFECEYIGLEEAAKSYGAFRLYRLRRRTPGIGTGGRES